MNKFCRVSLPHSLHPRCTLYETPSGHKSVFIYLNLHKGGMIPPVTTSMISWNRPKPSLSISGATLISGLLFELCIRHKIESVIVNTLSCFAVASQLHPARLCPRERTHGCVCGPSFPGGFPQNGDLSTNPLTSHYWQLSNASSHQHGIFAEWEGDARITPDHEKV